MSMNHEIDALLLIGPQYYDGKKPVTGLLKQSLVENLDPLGIGIVSRVLKQTCPDTHSRLVTMLPGHFSNIQEEVQNADVVLLSARTFDTTLAQEAIEIANRLHKPVVAGGYGPTFEPESFEDSTTIVQGEAELVLPGLFDDFLSGRSLQPVYSTSNIFNLSEYVWPDRSIYTQWPSLLNRFRHHPIEAMRGCFGHCSFCAATRLQRGGVRVREVSDIIGEIESMKLKKGDFLFFVDLNTTAIPLENLRELFYYLQKSHLRWFTEGTVAPLLADLEENGENNSLFNLMSAQNQKGGCYSFLYGADDLSAEKVAGSHDKEIQLLKKAADVFSKFGIPFNLSVIVGLDSHLFPESFFRAASIIKEVRPSYTFVHIATPMPGTPWGETISKQGRIFDHQSTHYNHNQPVFTPRKMSVEELQQGFYWLQRFLCNPKEIARSAKETIASKKYFNNPLLGLFNSGVIWKSELYLSLQELAARGYLNNQIQKSLDRGYQLYQGN